MPANRQPPITVSIVSHGQLALIRPLLDQLERYCADAVGKVVLTLNIPESEALDAAGWRIPVERIDNRAPKGFGANHNQAFARCETQWFLVLNPDIRLEADVLTPLLDRAVTNAGLLSPQIFEPGKSRPEAHRRIITPAEILSRKRPGYVPPAAPDWIPGLFMLFRSEAYRQVDGFDERFFMYGEDFDICARTRLAGWRIQIVDDLRATHEAQRASHRSRRHLYWHLSSLLRVWTSPVFWRLRSLQQR